MTRNPPCAGFLLTILYSINIFMKTPSPNKQRIGTQHVYKYETEFLSTFEYLAKQRSLPNLIKKGKQIWKNYYRGKRPFPTIKFGPGDQSFGKPMSFCLGYDYIELAPNQRDFLTLIHELVHAFGADYHDMKFVKIYFKLLKDHLPKYIADAVYVELVMRHRELLKPYK